LRQTKIDVKLLLMTENSKIQEILNSITDQKLKYSLRKEVLNLEKKLQELLAENQDLKQKIKDREKQKEDLISFTIHELRTPLTAIKAYTNLMILAPVIETKAEEISKIINLEIDRLNNLICDLLDLIKLEANEFRIYLEKLDLKNVVKQAEDLIKILADMADIKIRISLPPDLPKILGDKNKLIQVFTNLLSNAIKFSPDHNEIEVRFEVVNTDSPKIKIDKKELPNTQKLILISIRDHGIGINKQNQQLLFQRFKQIPGVKGRYKGTGLGLMISKEIILKHHGNIWLESETNKGTTIFFYLPLTMV